jgi:hypothetical protein
MVVARSAAIEREFLPPPPPVAARSKSAELARRLSQSDSLLTFYLLHILMNVPNRYSQIDQRLARSGGMVAKGRLAESQRGDTRGRIQFTEHNRRNALRTTGAS